MARKAANLLRIHLLGEFHILVNDKPIPGLAAERPQTLLAYLLLNRHAPQSRQQLAFMLWPDSSESQARTNLRNLLHTLRQVLPDPQQYLVVEPLTLQWRPEAAYSLDVADFEAAVEAANQTEDEKEMRQQLITAVSLYQGDLLPGNYDDWLMPSREALRQMFLSALQRLVRLLEQGGDFQTAIYHAQRLLQQDTLNESSYILLMRLHALSNDRAGVRRVYQSCLNTLNEELGVEPAAATQAAYNQLLRMDVVVPEEITAIPTPAPVAFITAEETPPPAAPSQQPRPLPIPPTPFVGRETELAEIAQLLADPDCRLLTLVGLGGMGKTRLALQTAVGHQPIFKDGVAFVSLAPLQEADLLVSVIGDALQFTFFSATEPDQQLFQFLSQKEILLVLDNFEHLLEGGETVSSLLSAAPKVKVLATSRQRLDLQGEWVYEIGGLPLPETSMEDELTENCALTLFRQSAQRADNHFALSAEEDGYVRSIIRLVDGMPLAIELAASWTRLLSCAEIAGEIERGLDFLAVSSRNIPERHRSIQTVFDHTWLFLTPREQRTLAQLSVFRGGFSREAAEEITGTTLGLLSALVDKSLVRRVETNRFDLHELIRQYAFEQLVKSHDFAGTNQRHFDYFLTMAEASKTKLRGRESITWLNLIEGDYDNFRSALEWAFKDHTSGNGRNPNEAYPGQLALRLTSGLYLFWKIRVHWGNGRRWLRRALDLTAANPVTIERIEAIKCAAMLALEQMDLPDAKALGESGLKLAGELDQQSCTAVMLFINAIVLWKQKDYQEARDLSEASLAMVREMGDKMKTGDTLQGVGRIAMNQGDLAAAQACLEEGLAIFEAMEDELAYSAILSDLGLLAYIRCDFQTARAFHKKSLALFREARSIAGIEMTLNRLGDVARCEGDYEEADRLYAECLRIFRETGDKDEIPSLLHNLGYTTLYRGQYEEAFDLFKEGLEMHRLTDNEPGMAECLAGIAAVLAAVGQGFEAARLFGTAEMVWERLGLGLWPANQLEYDRSMAQLSDSLPAADLKEAWEEGRATPLPEIIQTLPLLNQVVAPPLGD